METLASFLSIVLLPIVALDASCLTATEALIAEAPTFSEVSITTSYQYKRHIAEEFCEIGKDLTAMELGVYHGYTTRILATIFKKVIAVDINKGLLQMAAKTVGPLEENVVFLFMDLMSDDWRKLANNDVDVVIIDADHTYAGVRRDAENVLKHLPTLQWIVFHDTWWPQIERAVSEFEQEKILSCHNVGLGFDGLSYEYPQLDDDRKKIGVLIQDKPEGKICRRLEAWNKPPNYLHQLFMLYRRPISVANMCATAVFRLMPHGRINVGILGDSGQWESSMWLNKGRWKQSNESEGVLLVKAPLLAPGTLQLRFNMARSSFKLTSLSNPDAEFHGIYEDAVQRPFHVASALFWT